MKLECLPFAALLAVAAAMIGCEEKSDTQSSEAPVVEAREKPESAGMEKKDPAPLPAAEPVADEVEDAPPTEVVPRPVARVTNPPEGRTESFVLEDFSQIKVREGLDSPKIGDTIHMMDKLPENACGTYWMMDADGYVDEIAVCTGDHDH